MKILKISYFEAKMRIFCRTWIFSNRFLGSYTGYFILVIFSAVWFLSAILLISCIPKLSLFFVFGLLRFPFFGGLNLFNLNFGLSISPFWRWATPYEDILYHSDSKTIYYHNLVISSWYYSQWWSFMIKSNFQNCTSH